MARLGSVASLFRPAPAISRGCTAPTRTLAPRQRTETVSSQILGCLVLISHPRRRRHSPLWRDRTAAPVTPVASILPVLLTDPLANLVCMVLPRCFALKQLRETLPVHQPESNLI